MSVSALAMLRPLCGHCLRQSPTALLSLRVQSRQASFTLRAVVALRPLEKRFQSTTHGSNSSDSASKSDTAGATGKEDAKQIPKPKITIRQFMGRALTVGLRNLIVGLSPRSIRQACRDSPGEMALVLSLVAFTFVYCAYALYGYYRAFYGPNLSKFPEPVATSLRRAIYHTSYRPDQELALKYYRAAMQQAKDIGMDAFSDEVLGIRVIVAGWLEKIGNFNQSIEVLHSVSRGCLEWIANMEQQVDDGLVDDKGMLVPAARPPPPQPTVDAQDITPAREPEEEESQWHRRERLLRWAVQINVKLGELFADEHVLDPDKSHQHLLWAVETTLHEFQRRREEGPKPGEEKWLSPAEVGGLMESLGQDYERKTQFHLAIPLFFQALRNCEVPCHRAVIMNNLAACFAQHPIYSPADGGSPETESLKALFATSMPNSRKDCLEAAANWARNAYAHGKDVKGDDRTPECDQACAVALCNWGDVVAMQGNMELAKKKYTQAIELSQKLDFPEGVKQAQDGIKKLDEEQPRKRVQLRKDLR